MQRQILAAYQVTNVPLYFYIHYHDILINSDKMFCYLSGSNALLAQWGFENTNALGAATYGSDITTALDGATQVAGVVGAYALQIPFGVFVTAPVPATFAWTSAWKVKAQLQSVPLIKEPASSTIIDFGTLSSDPSLTLSAYTDYATAHGVSYFLNYPLSTDSVSSKGGIYGAGSNQLWGYLYILIPDTCVELEVHYSDQCTSCADTTRTTRVSIKTSNPGNANVDPGGTIISRDTANDDVNPRVIRTRAFNAGTDYLIIAEDIGIIGKDLKIILRHESIPHVAQHSPVLFLVDSVLELSETTSSFIPAVLTNAIDPGLGPNLARACSAGNCPVTGSTRYPCEPACPVTRVNDGAYDAYTRQTHYADQGWIQIDFETPVAIAQVRIWLVDSTYAIPSSDPEPGNLRNNDFAVWYGNQSGTPATQGAPNINCLTYSGTPMSLEIITCEGTARYLYLYFPGQSAAVREIEVYGPVQSAWKHVTLEHEVGFGTLAKLYVDGVELADAGANITVLYQGGGIRMTNVVVDDLRVYASANSNPVTETPSPSTTKPLCPEGQTNTTRNLARTCGVGKNEPCAVTASSEGSGVGAARYARVNDGTLDTDVFYTASGTSHWIEIDLGSRRNVTLISISNRQIGNYEDINGFKVYIGDQNAKDGEENLCHADTKSYTTAVTETVSCVGTGRYVYVTVEFSPARYFRVSEIQVLGPVCVGQEPSTPVKNLARICGGAESCAVSAYSTQGGHTDPPQMVLDGEKPTGYSGTVLWLAASPGYNYCGASLNTACTAESWLQIDLGQSRSVQTIGIWFRQDCCRERQHAFEIYLGDTASTKGLAKSAGNTMCYQDTTTAASTPLSLNATCVGFGRYVLLYFPQASASVGEIAVFGIESTTHEPTAIVVSNGLKAYFKLENSLENEIGTTTLQVKQNDNSVVANPTFTVHEGKASLQLDNLWIDTTHNLGSTHSVTCWVYAKNHFGAQYSNTPIFAIGDQNSGGEIALSGRQVYTTPIPQTSVNYVNTGDFDSTMAWFHIAFVQNGGEWEIFVNGQKLYDNFAFAADKKNEMIGAFKLFRYVNKYSLNVGYLNGYAKCLRLYDRVLTATEVQTIHDVENSFFVPAACTDTLPAGFDGSLTGETGVDTLCYIKYAFDNSDGTSTECGVNHRRFMISGACMHAVGYPDLNSDDTTIKATYVLNVEHFSWSENTFTTRQVMIWDRDDSFKLSDNTEVLWPGRVEPSDVNAKFFQANDYLKIRNCVFNPGACTTALPVGFDCSLTGQTGTNGVCYIKYAGTGGNPSTSTGQSLGACDQDHTYFYVSKSCIQQLGYTAGSTLTVEHYRGSTKQADRGIIFWWYDTTWNGIGPNGDHDAFPGNTEKLLQGRTNPTGSNVFRSNDYFVIPSI